MFYSPFVTKDGYYKSINQINFEDLKQIKEKNIKEGLYVEYKLNINDSVLAKLPKEISAFCNENGGWIIIGIEDTTFDILPIEEKEYELQISNKVNGLCNPKIEFYYRFIKDKIDDNKGIIILYIPEGNNPPYLFQSKIYRRIGSSSELQKEADRADLDFLYNKSKKNNEKIKNFCKKEISIFNRTWNSFAKDYRYDGLCNIYLIPKNYINLLENKEPEDLSNEIKNFTNLQHTYSSENYEFLTLTGNIPFIHSNYTNGAIVFRTTDNLNLIENCIGWEQLFNGKAKFHFPLKYFEEKEELVFIPEKFHDQIKSSNFNIVDGVNLLSTITLLIGQYLKILKSFVKDLPQIILVFEFEYIRKDILYFSTNSYREYFDKHGIIFSDKNNYFINNDFVDVIDSDDLMKIFSQVANIAYIFGIEGSNAIQIMIDLIKGKNVMKI